MITTKLEKKKEQIKKTKQWKNHHKTESKITNCQINFKKLAEFSFFRSSNNTDMQHSHSIFNIKPLRNFIQVIAVNQNRHQNLAEPLHHK